MKSVRAATRVMLCFAIATGLVMSMTTPASGIVLELITYELKPPVGSKLGRAQLNCGWHSSCNSDAGYPTGNGLDWARDKIAGVQSESDPYQPGQGTCCLSTAKAENVYARAWVKRSTYNVISAVMRIRTVQNDGACRQVEDRMHHWSTEGVGPYLGKTYWMHTLLATPTEWWSVSASKAGLYNRALVAKMVTSASQEVLGCAPTFWDGTHVHDEHQAGVGTWVNGTNIPQATACNQGADNFCQVTYNDPGSQTTKVQRALSYQRVADPCEQAEVGDYCDGFVYPPVAEMSNGDGDVDA